MARARRHTVSKGPRNIVVHPKLPFGKKLAATLNEAMNERGFTRLTQPMIEKALSERAVKKDDRPRILETNEVIFQRGDFGRGRIESNFNVFVRIEDKELTVCFYNPRDDYLASSLSPQEIHVKRVLQRGNIEQLAMGIVAEAEMFAVQKSRRPGEYRAQIHCHTGWLQDDGKSKLRDVVRQVLYHNLDLICLTPHNSFQMSEMEKLKAVFDALGTVFLPGMELTAPIIWKDLDGTDKKNGPHLVLVMSNAYVGNYIHERITSKRKRNLRMASFFVSGEESQLTLDKMLEILEPLRKQNMLLVGAGHPVNYNDRILPIFSVGMLSAAENHGELHTVEDARGFLEGMDFVGAFNPTISDDEMKIRNNELKAYLTYLLRKYNPKARILTANNCNLALAKMLRSEFGLGTTFDSDDHTTPPFEFEGGGENFSWGHTRMIIPPEKIIQATKGERRLCGMEIIEMLKEGRNVGLEAIVFREMAGGVASIVPERQVASEGNRMKMARLKTRQYTGYARDLLHDAFEYVKQGRWKDLGRMSD